MSINSIRKSLTITKQQQEWLDEHPEVNTSQILQVGIDRQKELYESSLTFKENKALRERIERMAKTINGQAEFIEKKGLTDECFHYLNDKHERGEQ